MRTVQLSAELRASLRKNAAFAIFDDAGLDELIARLELASYRIGELIVTEGEPGDCGYIVYTGRCRVFKMGTAGKPVTLGSLGPGEFFGEQVLLTGRPRSASVRASEDSALFRLSRAAFEGLVARHPEVRDFLERFLRDRAVVDFLRSSTFLGTLPPGDMARLLSRLNRCEFAANEVVVRQGEPGTQMFLVLAGELQVTLQTDAGETRILSRLTAGQYFGERSLLRSAPRSATVTSMTASQCLSLSAEDFQAVLAKAPQLLEQFERQIERYTITEEMQAKYGLKPPVPQERRQPTFQLPPETGLPQTPTGSTGLPPRTGEAGGETKVRRQRLRKQPAWSRFPVVRQLDEMDCGAASLAMISKYYGISVSLTRLRELASIGREGASMYSLSVAAEKLGYGTRAVRTDYQNLQNVTLPAIAHWKGYHYIVVYEAGPEQVTLADPASGLTRMTRREFEQGWTGRLLLLTPTEQLETVEPETTTFGRFLPLLMPYRWVLFEVLLASVILDLLQLAAPMFTQTIVDKVLVHQNKKMLNTLLGGMVIIGAFQTLTRLLRQYLLIHVSQKLKLRMSADLFRYLVRLPMRFFHTRRIGELLQRFQDNERLQQVMTGQAVAVVLDVLMVFSSLALMLYYSPQLTAVAVLPIPVYGLLTLIFTPLWNRNHLRLVEQKARTESSLIETINSIGAVKTGCAEQSSQWKHENHLVKSANIEMWGARLWMRMSGISSGIHIFASTLMLWYGSRLVIDGKLSIGQLMAFQSLIQLLITPILALMGVWNQLQEALASLKRLNDLYETRPEFDPRAAVPGAPHLQGHVRIENVSFRYNADGRNILAGITLDVPPGQRVALVGRSGSGKTTLVTLLQRFYDPTEGRILVDGCDLTKVDVRSYREQIGVVAQDSTLFSGTIRENIALGDPDAGLDRVVAVARLANAHDFILALPMGYETVVGDAGVRISGGQKQRICIARALLKDPRIIIFDEATSSLDTESEKVIQENMKPMLAGRTAFIIAHRLSTVQDADLIVVLDEGVIVEKGTHRELLAMKGLYFYLASQQIRG
ncbi:MAG: ATP-binding cassette domain-containing protein, partial [Planctomycetaceae bacterium]